MCSDMITPINLRSHEVTKAIKVSSAIITLPFEQNSFTKNKDTCQKLNKPIKLRCC